MYCRMRSRSDPVLGISSGLELEVWSCSSERYRNRGRLECGSRKRGYIVEVRYAFGREKALQNVVVSLTLQNGRHDWTRTSDLYRVKVAL
jgi:hypothetical protein